MGNASSSIAQIFNVPQGIASAGPQNALRGLGRSLASMFEKDKPMDRSGFLKERYFRTYDKFNKGLLSDSKKFAAWMTGVLDEAGSKYIWNSHYEKALADKIPNAIKYADDMTRSMVAGRGVGEVPLAQKSRLFQLVAPFQLEVGNLWWVMKDFVDEKQFGKLSTLFMMNFLFNKAAEKIRGSDVTFDPINATLEALQTYQEEPDKKTAAIKAGGRMAGEVISNVPGGQSLAAMYPEYGFKVGETEMPARKEFFGKGDPTRYGTGLVAVKGMQDPLYKVVPPFGGQQIKRTIEGVKSVIKGYSEGANGQVKFPIDKNPINVVKSGIFGPNATQEGTDYYKQNKRPLSDKQSEQFKDMGKPYYDQVMQQRDENKYYDGLKKGEAVNIKSGHPKVVANAVYRYLNSLDMEKRQSAYDNIKYELPKGTLDEMKAIGKLEKEGFARADRDIMLIPEELRARAVYDRLMGIDKKNRQEKYYQLQEAGLITPTVKEMLKKIARESIK